MRQTTKAEVCLDEGKSTSSGPPRRATRTTGCERGWLRPKFIAMRLDETEDRAQSPRNPGNVGLSTLMGAVPPSGRTTVPWTNLGKTITLPGSWESLNVVGRTCANV